MTRTMGERFAAPDDLVRLPAYGVVDTAVSYNAKTLLRFIPGVIVVAICAGASPARAQERAYFTTYDHYLEESGDLEIALASTTGLPKQDRAAYSAPWLELEYGFTGWWTAELYLEGVTTRGDGSAFTGWRWENRFRPLRSEHRLNPVWLAWAGLTTIVAAWLPAMSIQPETDLTLAIPVALQDERAAVPSALRDVLTSVSSEDFVNKGLISDAPAARFFAELIEHSGIDSNGDQLPGCIAKRRPADAPHGLQLRRG